MGSGLLGLTLALALFVSIPNSDSGSGEGGNALGAIGREFTAVYAVVLLAAVGVGFLIRTSRFKKRRTSATAPSAPLPGAAVQGLSKPERPKAR